MKVLSNNKVALKFSEFLCKFYKYQIFFTFALKNACNLDILIKMVNFISTPYKNLKNKTIQFHNFIFLAKILQELLLDQSLWLIVPKMPYSSGSPVKQYSSKQYLKCLKLTKSRTSSLKSNMLTYFLRLNCIHQVCFFSVLSDFKSEHMKIIKQQHAVNGKYYSLFMFYVNKILLYIIINIIKYWSSCMLLIILQHFLKIYNNFLQTKTSQTC